MCSIVGLYWLGAVGCFYCVSHATAKAVTSDVIGRTLHEGASTASQAIEPHKGKKTIYLLDDKPPKGRPLLPPGNTQTLASRGQEKAVDVHPQNTGAKDDTAMVCTARMATFPLYFAISFHFQPNLEMRVRCQTFCLMFL